MSGIWGNKIKLSIFGESHGAAIGITIDGLRSGFELNLELIKIEMKKRAPGNSELSTKRKEGDDFQILSGFFNGKTTGTPLCAIIYNSNQNSSDYEQTKNLLRPSHADYTGYYKYKGFNDYRGGGHFSGRLTAPLVFAGAVSKQLLNAEGIFIASHIKSIAQISDIGFDPSHLNARTFSKLNATNFPVLTKKLEAEMKQEIILAKEDKDSVGGIIETSVINLPVGIGEPFFDSVESTLAHLIFSVPAVKGLEFGAGFDITKLRGSLANDPYYIDGGEIKTKLNNNGGINGGITNGMPIIFRTAIKPTPSIGKAQNTVDISKNQNTTIKILGRHDPCIVQRALPVIEAVTAIAIVDLIKLSK